MKPHYYTQEQLDFLRNETDGKLCAELTKLFNDHFGLCLSESQIRACKKRHKMKSGLNTTFKKGGTAHNKGKKMSDDVKERIKHTFFKKGNKPHNHLPIGTEIKRSDGYIQVKVGEPNIWEFRARIVWEKEKGKIPKGYCLIRKDKDKENDSLENLVMVKRNVHLELNHRGLMVYGEPEINESAINIARIDARIKEIEKGRS